MAGNDAELLNAAVVKKFWQKPSKIIILVIVLLGLSVGTYYTYKSFAKKDINYLTMPVSKGAIVDEIQATGTVKPLHEVDLYFRQQGTLKSLFARSGDTVQEGQVLALQDNATLEAQVEQARSDLQQSKYKLQQSQLECEKLRDTANRQDELYKQGAVAQSDWEQAKRDYQNVLVTIQGDQVSIQSSQAKLLIAENNLKNAELTAPFSGVAAQVNGEVGQETGNSSSPMFHLISNELQLLAMVNEVDVGRVKVNQEVSFTVTSYPGKTFKGTVTRISPQSTAVNNVQLYEVGIAAKDISQQLRAGMSVTAKIIVDKREKVVMVPNIALTYTQTYLNNKTADSGQSINRNATQNSTAAQSNKTPSAQEATENTDKTQKVVVLQGDKPIVKTITVGMSDGQNTEVINGLNVGDRVVIGTNATSSSNTGNSGNKQTGGQQQRTPMGGGIPGAGQRMHD